MSPKGATGALCHNGSRARFDYGFALAPLEKTLQDGRRTMRVQERCYSGGYLGTSDPELVCSEADRAFFREVLRFPAVDAGEGWLIFALPPAEMAVHPADANGTHELYLMTDDVDAEIARLEAAGVECAAVEDRGYGLMTSIALPGGGSLGLYQPRHPLAHGG